MRLLTRLVLAALVVGAGGCGGEAAAPAAACSPGANRSLSADVAPIIVGGCSGSEICHGPFGGPANLHAELVGVPADFGQPPSCHPSPRVTPGDPEHSYLMNKLLGVGMCPGTQRMPLGTPLLDSQIQVIRDWICEGAPNN
jgi:hypothetical protein